MKTIQIVKLFYTALLGAVLWAGPSPVLQAQTRTAGPVSPAVTQAFKAAGLPVLRQRTIPVDFSAELPDGSSLKLSDLKGKVVFLNFWATWCGPCRQEMPSMDSLYRRFHEKGFEILAVNCQESPREVETYIRSNEVSFAPALDPSGGISGRYGITALPTTFIIDREGAIIARVIGSLNWNDPKIAAAFETLLKE